MLSRPGSLGNTEGILNPLWVHLGEGLAPRGSGDMENEAPRSQPLSWAPSPGACAGIPPLPHPAGKERCPFSLTLLPLEVVSPPEAHVDLGPRLRLLNHRGLHTDQVLP